MRRRLSNRELDAAARHYDGPYKPYDLIKELCVATGAIALLAVLLAFVFSSPDLAPSTIAQWSRQMPVDFVTTAVAELDGTSDSAGYGPPYNHASTGQQAAFIHLQQWLGVSHPIDTAQDFVFGPLADIPDNPAPGQPSIRAAVAAYRAAPAKTQAQWTGAYTAALDKATVVNAKITQPTISVPPGKYGPVPTLMSALLALGQSGGLDGALLTSRNFYQTDYTKPLMFMADGGALAARAQQQHLLGSQWGMMNETGSYPGQVWLWLYTFWYQVKPFSTSDNADLLVFLVMGFLSLLLVLIPFIPGLRDIPRWVPLYRYIWRDHYRAQRSARGP